MGDPSYSVAAAVGLTLNITKLTSTIRKFVSRVNDAQGDLELVRAELASINKALEFLTMAESGLKPQTSMPSRLQNQVSGTLVNIGDIVRKIEACLEKQNDMRLSKKFKWATSGRVEMDKLRTTLEAHKSELGLTLELLSLYGTSIIQGDTAVIRQESHQILAEVSQLRSRLDSDHFRIPCLQDSPAQAYPMLQRYLDHVSEYAKSILESNSAIDEVSSNVEQGLIGEDTGSICIPPDHRDNWIRNERSQMNFDEAFSTRASRPAQPLRSEQYQLPLYHHKQLQPAWRRREISAIPDTVAMQRAKDNRERLYGENLTKIDQSLWIRSFEISEPVHDSFTFLQTYLEAGADPDPPQAVPYGKFDCSTGLVWRILKYKNYPCLQLALRFGARYDRLDCIDSEGDSMTPLAYCAERLDHQAVDLLLRAGANPGNLECILNLACQANSNYVGMGEYHNCNYRRRRGHDQPLFNMKNHEMPLPEENEGADFDQGLQRVMLLDVFVCRLKINTGNLLQKCVHMLASLHSSCERNTLFPHQERSLFAFTVHLLRTGAFYPDMLRDICSLCPNHHLSLDLVQLVIAQARLIGKFGVVNLNLGFKCGLVHTQALPNYHQLIRFLLQEGAKFDCLEEMLYLNVIAPCYRYSVADLGKSEEFCTLALETFKVVHERKGKFDLFQLRDWEGMYGWNETSGFHSDHQCRPVNFSGFLDNRRRLELPSLSLIEDELWKFAPPDQMVLLCPELMNDHDSDASRVIGDVVGSKDTSEEARSEHGESKIYTNLDKILGRLHHKLKKRARLVAPQGISIVHGVH